MAETVSVHFAKTHFSRLLARASAGEETVIARAGEPVARLLPIAPSKPKKRTPGIDKGKIWMAKDIWVMSKRELSDWYPSYAVDSIW
jgi:prevent-host-death family protein